MKNSNAATVIRPTYVTADTIPHAWLNSLSTCLYTTYKSDAIMDPDAGIVRHEMGFLTLGVKTPGEKPLIQELRSGCFNPIPGGVSFIEDYVLSLLTGNGVGDAVKFIGQRLNKVEVSLGMDPETHRPELDNVWLTDGVLNSQAHWLEDPLLNQVEAMIWLYSNKGHHLRDVTLQVGSPVDMSLRKSPRLRHIDTKILDGKLHFFPYFREWDLLRDMCADLVALETLKKHCSKRIGVGNGELTVSSKGAYILGSDWDLADRVKRELVLYDTERV